MSSEPRPSLARRVVTGVNAEGRSTIVSDTETPTWVRRPTGSVIMDLWSTQSMPIHVDDESSVDGGPELAPPRSGLCVRMAVSPPDQDIDEAGAATYASAMRDLYG